MKWKLCIGISCTVSLALKLCSQLKTIMFASFLTVVESLYERQWGQTITICVASNTILQKSSFSQTLWRLINLNSKNADKTVDCRELGPVKFSQWLLQSEKRWRVFVVPHKQPTRILMGRKKRSFWVSISSQFLKKIYVYMSLKKEGGSLRKKNEIRFKVCCRCLSVMSLLLTLCCLDQLFSVPVRGVYIRTSRYLC